MKKVISAVKTTTEGISGVKDIITQWEKEIQYLGQEPT